MTVKLFERVTPVIQGVVIELWKRSDVLLCGITASVAANSYTGVQLICRTISNTDIDGVVWVGGGCAELCSGSRNYELNLCRTCVLQPLEGSVGGDQQEA